MKNYDFAREILGDDFISPEEVMNSRKGVVYTKEQLEMFFKTIPKKEILEWCKTNSYILVAGPHHKMRTIDVKNLKSNYFSGNFFLIKDEILLLCPDTVEVSWVMIKKEVVSESISKNWEEQQSLLSEFEIVPNLAEFIWAITTYHSVRCIYLFNKTYAKTSSIGQDGHHVRVGSFDEIGMGVSNYKNTTELKNLGIAASRKI